MGPHQQPPLQEAWSWTSSLRNCEKIHFCCLSCSSCGVLSWQPELSSQICLYMPRTFLECPRTGQKLENWSMAPGGADWALCLVYLLTFLSLVMV